MADTLYILKYYSILIDPFFILVALLYIYAPIYLLIYTRLYIYNARDSVVKPHFYASEHRS